MNGEQTMKVYMQFNIGTLLENQNGIPIKDLDGNPIECVGSWNSPGIADQCRSAIWNIHNSFLQQGPYR